MSVTAKNFYRRPLPDTCIDFASDEGKKLFTESLIEGNANIYFKLASQFLTQDEPAYCGLSTLVMVLNALEVDPEQVWKAPWRFYHESMLDCCVPLENVKKNDVISSVRGETTVVVTSYDRSQLAQTGTGHFSPLAAYHSKSDRVLILDVARFKYPPHWITLSQLQAAMNTIDPSTKKVRGFVTLKLKTDTRPLVMFGLKCNMSHNEAQKGRYSVQDFADAVIAWDEHLLCDSLPDEQEELAINCRRFAQCFSPHALCCTTKQIEGELEKDASPCACELSEASRVIVSEIRETSVGVVFQNSAVAALMLSWPFDASFSERSAKLKAIVDKEMQSFSPDTKNEIDILRTQIITLMGCSRPPIRLARGESTSSRCSQNTRDCCCKTDVRL